ncbi:MAG: T9SS type A sorting domain-containing protein, partial [Flavobacteriales bacterium]
DGEKAEASRHINFYPNPMMVGTDGNMRVPEELMGTTLRVSDLNGRTLSESKINSYESKVPLSGLPMGAYIVSIWDGKNRVFNEKVVVTR